MRKFNIGVVWSPQISLIDYHRLLHSYAQVRLIMPDEARMVELLVIPDGIGLYPGDAAFITGKKRNISPKIMCPYAEVFRHDQLPWFLEKEIPVAGIGDGAAWLWAHLGGKIAVSPDNKYNLIPNSVQKGDLIEIVEENGEYVNEFNYVQLHGFRTTQSENFFRLLRSIKDALVADAEQYKNTPTTKPDDEFDGL